MVRIRAVLDERTPNVCREANGGVLIASELLPHDTGDEPCRCFYQPEDGPELNEALVEVRDCLRTLEQRDSLRGTMGPAYLLLLDLHQRTTDMEDVLVKRVSVLEQALRDLRDKLEPLG